MFRWLVTNYPEPSSEEVNELYHKDFGTKAQCRRHLKKPSTKVLQYGSDRRGWRDVPTLTVEWTSQK